MSIKREAGFTLVELTIAMVIASIAITGLIQGTIQLLHIYETNVALNATQQAARTIVKDIDADARNAATASVSLDRLCLFSNRLSNGQYDGFRYTVKDRTGVVINGKTPRDIYRTTFTGINAATDAACATATGVDKRMNEDDVSAAYFQSQLLSGNTLVKLQLSIASSFALDLLAPGTPPVCQPGAGSQYCSVTTLSSSVMMRLTP